MSQTCRLTIDNVREHIVGIEAQVPLLDGTRRQYVNFDNAASTPALAPVFDKVNEFLVWYSSVARGAGFKSQIATEAYELAHDIVACFLGANLETNTVIFGKNTTEAMNKAAYRFPLTPEDIVLVSLMEHHSNDLPWRQRATVHHVGVRDDGALDEDDYDQLLERYAGRVKLVAISGAQNVTGYINPIHRLAEKAHAVGARICIDAAQLAPHRAIDMRPDDDPQHLDFVAIAGHKMYAPYGTGALVGPKAIFEQGTPDQVGGGTVRLVTREEVRWAGAPERDEAGSPNVVGAVALAQAILCLQEIGMDAIARHEAELTAYALRRLRQIRGLHIYGPTDPDSAGERLGTFPFTVEGADHYKVSAVLSCEGGIGVRNGFFCAHPYLLHLLGISGEEALNHLEEMLGGLRVGRPGMVRASLGCYNTVEEIDHFVSVLDRISTGDVRGDYVQDPLSGTYHAQGFEPNLDEYFALHPGMRARRREGLTGACVA